MAQSAYRMALSASLRGHLPFVYVFYDDWGKPYVHLHILDDMHPEDIIALSDEHRPDWWRAGMILQIARDELPWIKGKG